MDSHVTVFLGKIRFSIQLVKPFTYLSSLISYNAKCFDNEYLPNSKVHGSEKLYF